MGSIDSFELTLYGEVKLYALADEFPDLKFLNLSDIGEFMQMFCPFLIKTDLHYFYIMNQRHEMHMVNDRTIDLLRTFLKVMKYDIQYFESAMYL